MAQSYMFLLYDNADAFGDEPPSPEEWQQQMALHGEFAANVTAAGGRILGGEALAPVSAATTVVHRPGEEPVVTDGPFVETKEVLGGFYLIECADLDQAVAFARILPAVGGVEVRPVIDTSGG
jgi:hypothetical protein